MQSQGNALTGQTVVALQRANMELIKAVSMLAPEIIKTCSAEEITKRLEAFDGSVSRTVSVAKKYRKAVKKNLKQ